MTDESQITICLEDEPGIVYPSSDEDVPEIDGLGMEPVYSEVQQALIARFGGRDDVLVAGNSFIYYKMNGHPERTWLDCFVAFGVDRDAIRNRRCYYTWKTGKAPDFVLEIRTPTKVSADDGESAWRLYPALGITEYWIVDTASAGSGRRGLRGNRLVDGRYEKMALVTEAADAARGYSPTLGLGLSLDGDRLRLLDPTVGNCALSVIEEREARLAAEAENRQLREQLQRVNREHGQLRE